jgi:hypothetical protein
LLPAKLIKDPEFEVSDVGVKRSLSIAGLLSNIYMKKNILLLAVMCICTSLSAQHFRQDDTVVVFKLTIGSFNGMIQKYIPYKIQNTVKWSDKQNIVHKSVLRRINSGYLLLDTTKVYPAEIAGLDISPSPGFFPSQTQTAIPLIPDSSGQFNIMSYDDFRILIKTKSYTFRTQHIHDPLYKSISPEKYEAKLEQEKQHRLGRLAALDTCPLHYGIKTNLLKDLTNEINLSFEMPVKRSFCIDVGVGIIYSGTVSSTPFADEAFAQFKWLKSANQFWFDHSFYNRKGFSLEVIPKFFLSKKKQLYVGPQLCFRYFHYQDKWVFNFDDGSDYYHRDYFSFQTEKSASAQLNAIFGVQTPQIKKFVFDAFVSFGFMYRGGIVYKSIEKTYYHEGTRIEYYDPALIFKGGGFSLSGQIGLRMGFRFGKAKLYK